MSKPPRFYASAQTSFIQQVGEGCGDVLESLKSARIWFALGLNDVVARYRGSILGPFWITLTTLAFVLGIGFLYAGLMKVPTDKYLPWMTTGIVAWGMISQTVLEGGDAFISAGNVLRQTAIPIPLFIWRVVWRNLLTFIHQLPVLIGVGLWFHFLTRMDILHAAVGLCLIVLNTSWVALLAAVACARFRDVQQVLASIMQLIFFLSPVLWIPSEVSGAKGALLLLNPVVHMLNVFRGPLLAQGFSNFSALYLLASGLVGWCIALLVFSRVRRRVVHYV